MMERLRLHKILEEKVKEYVKETKPIIKDSMLSYIFEHPEDNDRIMVYNIEVAEAEEFPVWICRGGDTPPTRGCTKLFTDQTLMELDGNHKEKPRRCDFCGGTEFQKIESLEEWREWFEN